MNEMQVATAVIGLTQTIKMINVIPSKFLPAIAVVLGIALSIIVDGLSVHSGMKGLVIGLSSTGLVNRADYYVNGKKKTKRVKTASKPDAEPEKTDSPASQPAGDGGEDAPPKTEGQEGKETVPPTPASE